MPGGGLEPPWPEGRRILSPLRLPVPPSRRFLQVTDSTAYFRTYSLSPKNNEWETVQESVKVFEDLHRPLSFCR